MPYIPAGRRRGICLVATLAAVVLAPATANAAVKPPDWIANTLSSAGVDSPACTDPALTQPFLGWNDQNLYVLAPGESDSNFTGEGWLLLNGANITTGTLNDGTSTNVLDLPGGSMAVSPPMCVAANYPTARTMVQNVGKGGGAVTVYVTYAGTDSWSKAENGGNATPKGKAWGLSDNIQLKPKNTPGWQIARFALVPNGGDNSEYQVYNFYVDPYAKR